MGKTNYNYTLTFLNVVAAGFSLRTTMEEDIVHPIGNNGKRCLYSPPVKPSERGIPEAAGVRAGVQGRPRERG